MIHLRCLWGHDWTGDAEQGIGPPNLNMDDLIAEFNRYTRMWCKRCRRYMKPNKHLRGSEDWDANVKYRPHLTEATDDGLESYQDIVDRERSSRG